MKESVAYFMHMFRLITDLFIALLRKLPAEFTVKTALRLLASRLSRYAIPPTILHSSLQQELCRQQFENPLGMAAGFDKDAEAYSALLDWGFAFVEVGTVTLPARDGNAGKRLFRLPKDKAIINNLGFPSHGMDKVLHRLRKQRRHILGVNIGYSDDSRDIFHDYRQLARQFASHADYLTMNVSCPNMQDGRDLQSSDYLPKVIEATRTGATAAGRETMPLFLKISPDSTDEELAYIYSCAAAYNISALIMGNTTTSRPPGLRSKNKNKRGGLSGRPLFALSTERLARLYVLSEGRMPLIGVGGIFSAADAYVKIKAGASLLQLYTGLVYCGPSLIGDILRELPHLLEADGYAHISEAIGVDAHNYAQK